MSINVALMSIIMDVINVSHERMDVTSPMTQVGYVKGEGGCRGHGGGNGDKEGKGFRGKEGLVGKE